MLFPIFFEPRKGIIIYAAYNKQLKYFFESIRFEYAARKKVF
jgi:hypothetical protein